MSGRFQSAASAIIASLIVVPGGSTLGPAAAQRYCPGCLTSSASTAASLMSGCLVAVSKVRDRGQRAHADKPVRSSVGVR